MVATTLQKWLAGLIGLGALYLVMTNSSALANLGTAVKTGIGGTETSIISGGKS
jgi:hypothetical protein